MNAYAPIQRELPCNIEAEQALLGAVLLDNRAYHAPRVGGRIKPEHFHEKVHQLMWEAVEAAMALGQKVDPILLKSRFPGGKITDDITISEYLVRLAANAVTTINAPDYADAVHDAWLRRLLIKVADDVSLAAMDTGSFTPPAEIIDRAMMDLQSAADDGSADESRTADAFEAFLTDPIERITAGVPITYPPLAEVLNQDRFEAGNLYGMLSGSGEGKTSLTLQLVQGAMEKGHPVLILSFDQSPSQICQQMAQQKHGITMKRQRERRVSDSEFMELAAFAKELRKARFEVVKCTDEKAERLALYTMKWLKRLPSGHKEPLVVVDYIQAVTAEDERADAGTKSRKVSRKMKALAEEIGGAVLVLHQRNNDGNHRPNPRPIRKDLYGGEAARWDYDAVFYLYRPDTYRQQQLEAEHPDRHGKIHKQFEGWGPNDAEIGLLKHRFGDGRAKARIEFEPQFTRYRIPYSDPQEGFFQ